MKEICIAFKHSASSVVFRVGRDHGDGIVHDIRRDGNSVVVVDDDGTERVFPNAEIIWYVEDEPVALELV